ncbi:hypothetical protein [Hephaestia mangrovi]|uniref:hypothetical protein n=1 Tax=Hephaestia mangrovi TaxID=2873268 RepID=UPI001CA6A691|nr:hypothetical protein [Hephaestia mangrovi]MBY8828208.1 hypothetical protein [Hephaestia mangrovi]
MSVPAAMAIALLIQAQALETVTPPAPKPTPDATAMVTHYTELTSVDPRAGHRCDSAAPGDIVVCSARRSDQRLPLPDERGPPVGPSPEPIGTEANCVAATGRACQVCPPTGCTGVNLLAVPLKLFRIVRAVVDPEH